MNLSRPSKVVLILAIVVFFFGNLKLNAQNNRNDEPISDQLHETLKQRKQLIEEEVSHPDANEWSGTYLSGDHHPTVFMWSKSQGFLTWGSNHTFFPSRINFGKADFSDNLLILKPEISKEDLNFQSVPTKLVPIKWGEQHYLISSDNLINFAYAVHSGAVMEIVNYFVKSEDYEKSREGLPNLPREYENILKMKAIKAKVIEVKFPKEKETYDAKFLLNVGTKDKIIKGMTFYYADSANSLTLIVIDVQEKTSKAKIFAIASNETNEKEFEPKVGLKVTSKIPENYFDYYGR